MLASFLVLRSLTLARLREKPSIGNSKAQNQKQSGILTEFRSVWTMHSLQMASLILMRRRYSHIPLSLLYSSLNKLFLLVLLAIWRPAAVATSAASEPLSPQYNASFMVSNPILLSALELLDDDKLNREWVLRNILGGMAAGFGLRSAYRYLFADLVTEITFSCTRLSPDLHDDNHLDWLGCQNRARYSR